MELLFRCLVGWLWLMSTLPTPAAGTDVYVAQATLLTNPTPPAPGATSSSFVVGTIKFTQNAGESKVLIEGKLQLETTFSGPNTIGFHIHQTSDFTNGCTSAGSHYNPENKAHGGPFDATRHVGDLGNVNFTAEKTSSVSFSDSVISLVGRQTIVGRSLVIHLGTDDLGRGGQNDSLTTGHAGGRYACGPIVLVSDFSPSSAMSLLVSGSRLIMVTLVAMFSVRYGLQY